MRAAGQFISGPEQRPILAHQEGQIGQTRMHLAAKKSKRLPSSSSSGISARISKGSLSLERESRLVFWTSRHTGRLRRRYWLLAAPRLLPLNNDCLFDAFAFRHERHPLLLYFRCSWRNSQLQLVRCVGSIAGRTESIGGRNTQRTAGEQRIFQLHDSSDGRQRDSTTCRKIV